MLWRADFHATDLLVEVGSCSCAEKSPRRAIGISGLEVLDSTAGDTQGVKMVDSLCNGVVTASYAASPSCAWLKVDLPSPMAARIVEDVFH